jgi:mono/diheme cytochrome c family protein
MKINPARNLILASILLFFISCNNTFKQGEVLYKNNCANCHMLNGEGLQSLIPPLAGVNYLSETRAQIACIISYGLKDTLQINGKTYTEEMLPIPNLTEAEITNIINYINHAWENDYGYVKIKEVKEALKACKS